MSKRFEVAETIVEHLIDPHFAPYKVGLCITSRNAIEITSSCCADMVRYIREETLKGGVQAEWRCINCRKQAALTAEHSLPNSCLFEIDRAKTYPDIARLWVSNWTGFEPSDIEIELR